MYYIEDKDFLSKEQKDYINNTILSNRFPLFLNKDDVGLGTGNSWLSHTIVERKEIRVNNKITNPYSDFFFSNIKSDIDIDHKFTHKQLIIYLNQPQDTNSKTVVLDEDKETILKEIVPEQFKGVCFENKPHYHHYPRVGYRAVCVYTFR